MTAEVVPFGGISRLDIPAERVLQAAIAAGMSEVVICGFDSDGQEYFASSQADGGDVLWHLERAKIKLLRLADD